MQQHADETCCARLLIQRLSNDSVLWWTDGSERCCTTFTGPNYSVVVGINSKFYGHSIKHWSCNRDQSNGRTIMSLDFRPTANMTINPKSIAKVVRLLDEWAAAKKK